MNTPVKKTNSNGNMPASSFSGFVDNIFKQNLSRFFDDEFWGFNGLTQNVSVPVNIRETDKSYEMEMVAPGLRKEDFKIRINGELLTVSFEHQEEDNQQSKEEGWLRKEYRKRSFSRSFDLAETIDAGKIAAQYRDGILHISLPKKEGAQQLSRSIEIS